MCDGVCVSCDVCCVLCCVLCVVCACVRVCVCACEDRAGLARPRTLTKAIITLNSRKHAKKHSGSTTPRPNSSYGLSYFTTSALIKSTL